MKKKIRKSKLSASWNDFEPGEKYAYLLALIIH